MYLPGAPAFIPFTKELSKDSTSVKAKGKEAKVKTPAPAAAAAAVAGAATEVVDKIKDLAV